MNKEKIIKQTEEFVKSKLLGESSGHDYWHIYRVWKNAINIGKTEKVDMFVVELAALLHDISDWKFSKGDENAGPDLAKVWLEQQKVDQKIILPKLSKDKNYQRSLFGLRNPNKIQTPAELEKILNE